MEKTKILIADDNRDFCDILSKFLSADENFEIVGIAKDGLEALDLLTEVEPDVLAQPKKVALDTRQPTQSSVPPG